MSVKLLTNHGAFQSNQIVTLDSATENGLVTAKLATTDLTGGFYASTPVDQAVVSAYLGARGAGGNQLGSVDPVDGSVALIAGLPVISPRGARRFVRARDSFRKLGRPVRINVLGHSHAWGLYESDGSETELSAWSNSWPGVMRTELARIYGCAEAGFIPTGIRNGQQAGNSPAFVTYSAGATNGPSPRGPVNMGGTVNNASTITYALPVSTDFRTWHWGNNGSLAGENTGTYTHATADHAGGAAQAVVTNGAATQYGAGLQVSGLASSARSVVLTGTSATPTRPAGVEYSSNLMGFSVARFGQPSWTLADMLGIGNQNDRTASAESLASLLAGPTFNSPDLLLVQVLTNEVLQYRNQPVTSKSSPAEVEANLRAQAALASSKGGCMGIVISVTSDAPPSFQPWYDTYNEIARKIARDTDHVFCVDLGDRFGGSSLALADGFFYNSHPNGPGHFATGRLMADLLSSSMLGA